MVSVYLKKERIILNMEFVTKFQWGHACYFLEQLIKINYLPKPCFVANLLNCKIREME